MMNPSSISDDWVAQGDVDQSLAQFEAERIALRRVFEDGHGWIVDPAKSGELWLSIDEPWTIDRSTYVELPPVGPWPPVR